MLTDDLIGLMADTDQTHSKDRLDRITEKMREARDLKTDINELEDCNDP